MSSRGSGDKRGEKGTNLGKFIIARLKRAKHTAEMIVDPKEAWDAKKKINEKRKTLAATQENAPKLTIEDLKDIDGLSLNDIFEGFIVFDNAKKGDIMSDIIMEDVFETTDTTTIAYYFLLDNNTEWLWTKQQRDEYTEKKRKQIINILVKNTINPQTKKPHPPQRIEKAIKEAKYNINMNKTAEEQIKDVIHAISAVIPIKMETVELAVKIPASFAAKAYGTVEKYGRIKQSEWQNDGSWVGIMDITAGIEAEFLDKINKLTHGRAQIKILKRT